MKLAPLEIVPAGECPLCGMAMPVPRTTRTSHEALGVLDRHFGEACTAIRFPPPNPPSGLASP